MSQLSEMINSLKIKNIEMVGDRINNKYVDILAKDIREIKSCKLNKQIVEFIISECGNRRWGVSERFTQDELRRLNAIMRAKTAKTVDSKMLKYIYSLTNGSVYSLILKKSKIVKFCKTFGYEELLEKGL